DLNAHAFASAVPMIASLTESESHRLGLWGFWFFSQCWEVFQYSNHQLFKRSRQRRRRAIYDERDPSQACNSRSVSILQHDEAQLCGLRHRFGPTVCIKLGEYRSDMKLDGVERNTQSTGDHFVRSTARGASIARARNHQP